jgi:hypothetical protein
MSHPLVPIVDDRQMLEAPIKKAKRENAEAGQGSPGTAR